MNFLGQSAEELVVVEKYPDWHPGRQFGECPVEPSAASAEPGAVTARRESRCDDQIGTVQGRGSQRGTHRLGNAPQAGSGTGGALVPCPGDRAWRAGACPAPQHRGQYPMAPAAERVHQYQGAGLGGSRQIAGDHCACGRPPGIHQIKHPSGAGLVVGGPRRLGSCRPPGEDAGTQRLLGDRADGASRGEVGRHALIVRGMALFGRKKNIAPPPVPDPAPRLPEPPSMGPLGLRTVAAQRQYVLSMTEPLVPFGMQLLDAWGLSLCEDLKADGDLPPVAQAECDGFAIVADDLGGAEAPEGMRLSIRRDLYKVGAAVPVLAGQALPEGADAVLPMAHVEEDAGEITVADQVRVGDNIRQIGADAADGEVLVESGRRLDARIIGLLAGAGFDKVFCRPRPRVVVLAVGEHRPGGGEIDSSASQRRDAASHMVAAAAKADGAQVWREVVPGDDPAAVAEAVSDQLIRADLMIVCGGVVGGDAGLMAQALEGLGPAEFCEVAMEPGGQFGFGLIGQDDVPMLMMSSAPTAAYVSYQLFARPMIRTLLGAQRIYPEPVGCMLDEDLPAEKDVFQLLPGRLVPRMDSLHVRPLSGAGGLDVLTDADVLIVLPDDVGSAKAGEPVICWHTDD